MELARAGITDLDNTPAPLYVRMMAVFPAMLDVEPAIVAAQLMREAAAASGYGYATPNSCNIVAARWLAAWGIARDQAVAA